MAIRLQEFYTHLRGESEGKGLPDRFTDAGPKERFQVIVLVMWCRLTAWPLEGMHEHGT